MSPKPLPRHLRLLAAMYPRAFRSRYGEGFLSLLEDERGSVRVAFDLLLGALDAHLEARRGGRSLPALALRLFVRTVLAGTYALVSFPVAVAYFVFIVVGMAVGGSLLFTLIGVPIVAFTVLGVRYASRFERWFTASMLNVDIPTPLRTARQPEGSVFQLREGRFSMSLRDLRTYFFGGETLKGFVYLLLKFPASVGAFAMTLFLTSTGLMLLSAPIAHRFVDYEMHALGRIWVVHGWDDSVVPALAGLGLLAAAVLALNVFAFAWGEIARFCLGARKQAAEEMVPAA